MIKLTSDLSIWDLLFALLPIIGIILENQFNVILRIKKLWHKILNSPSQLVLNLVFKTDIDFNKLKDTLSNHLRQKYSTFKVYKSSNDIFEILVADSFTLTLYLTKQELSLISSKIKTGLRSLPNELDRLLDTVEDFQKDANNGSQNKKISDVEANVIIFLPYESTYAKIYPPKGMQLKDYGIEFTDKEYASVIKLKLAKFSINVNKTTDLDKIIKKLI